MKIYFHIGQAKTGTSAIQSFLNYNREILAKQYHILYPNFSTSDLARNSLLHNHANFFQKLHELDNQNKYAEFSRCLEYSIQNGINRIVFSAEMFEFEWLPILINEASIICKFNYTIILYLRRQDYYVEAAWKQWGHTIQNINTIQDYAKKVHLNWYNTIQLWLQHIPPEKFIIRPYEKSEIGKNITIDFMGLLGVASLIDFTNPPDNNLNKNHGLSKDVIEILKLCKSLDVDIHSNAILDFVSNSLSNSYKKPAMTNYNFLSPVERLKIIEQYAESNNKIASIFWGENAVLFKDTLPDTNEPWEPYRGLTLEKTIPIFMEILLNMQKQIQQIKNSNSIKEDDIYKNFFLESNCTFTEIKLENLLKKIKFNKQIADINISDSGISFMSTGTDPYLILPKSMIVRNMKAIKIEISVPENTTIQLFHKTGVFKPYIELYSIRKQLRAGRNTSILLLPAQGFKGKLRIDPGCHAGKYIIHKFEIGY